MFDRLSQSSAPTLLLLSAAGSLLALWAALVLTLLVMRPQSLSVREALQIMPDTLRLIRRLAADEALPRGVRVRLFLLLAYLALPFDLIPDFIPIIGQADDLIVTALVLRSVVRRAGAAALEEHWPGSAIGLSVVWKLAGLVGQPSQQGDTKNGVSGDPR